MPHHLLPFLESDPRVKGPLEEFQWRRGRRSLEFLLHCVTTSPVSHPNPAPPRQPLVLEGTSSLSMEGHLSPRAFWKGRRQKDVEGGIVARRKWGRGLTPSRPTDTPRHQHAYTRIHTHSTSFLLHGSTPVKCILHAQPSHTGFLSGLANVMVRGGTKGQRD